MMCSVPRDNMSQLLQSRTLDALPTYCVWSSLALARARDRVGVTVDSRIPGHSWTFDSDHWEAPLIAAGDLAFPSSSCRCKSRVVVGMTMYLPLYN